ncbi:PucR family transcriptional regulator [Actinomadura atramentaria]|uniref:PucR family transcriptional regulator n=1 Tax=Actinomadura atramentaria TaxID=1990 RepID=UPI00036902E6|nr:PucR family transcriptional regulator [Actinomadura atramentaria]
MLDDLLDDLTDRDAVLAGLRARVPDIARAAVERVAAEVPQYDDAKCARLLERAAERAADDLVALLAGDPPGAAALGLFRRAGAAEAREGRDLGPLRDALRTGAGVALRHLVAGLEAAGVPLAPTAVAELADAVYTRLDGLAAAAAAGHGDVAARAAGSRRTRRRLLLDALVAAPATSPARVASLAADGDWPLPRTVAAVALWSPPGGAVRPLLPPDVLDGLHLPEPCLVVPDPAGPGRDRALREALRGWTAAVGPAVPPAEAASSLRLARLGLDLLTEGVLAAPSPVAVTDHIPMIMLGRDPELASHLIERRLGPLLRSASPMRARLAETFLVCLECDFVASRVADVLHLHAQTIRYRLRQLEEMFGEAIYDPAQRLEFHLALRGWLGHQARAGRGPSPAAGVGRRRPVRPLRDGRTAARRVS